MIENRLRKNLKKIKKWLNKSNIEAYRLYDKDIPEYPYLIEVYKQHIIVYEKGKKLEDTQEYRDLRESKKSEIKEGLINIFQIQEDNIVFKIRESKDHQKEQYEKLNESQKNIIIQEEERKYLINPYDYLDTGLFLDHRWLRRELQNISEEKFCLNLFCYTGSISIAMACGDARRVDSVDLSNTYLNWTKKNFEVNQFNPDNFRFIRDSCFNYLKENEAYYDLIVCDPPSFSNSKKMTSEFDLQRDHVGLINLCMKNLKKGGDLYFSSNLRKFKIDQLLIEKYNVINITEKSFDPDINPKTKRHLFHLRFKK